MKALGPERDSLQFILQSSLESGKTTGRGGDTGFHQPQRVSQTSPSLMTFLFSLFIPFTRPGSESDHPEGSLQSKVGERPAEAGRMKVN